MFATFGGSKKSDPKVYFPCANADVDRQRFRDKIVEHCIPGLLASRPDIVDRLETYQHFGHTGNWLLVLVELVNEHKHEQLSAPTGEAV